MSQVDDLLERLSNLTPKQTEKIGATFAGITGSLLARRALIKALELHGYTHSEAKIALHGLTAGAYLLTTQVYSAWKNLEKVYA